MNRGENAAVPGGVAATALNGKWALVLLVAVGTCSAIDRLAVAIMGPAIAADLNLSDFQLGLMSGFGFAVVYLLFGLPLARMADRGNRVGLIAISVAIWSLFLILCSGVRNFAHLMICKAVISVGEVGVQPAAVSLVSDLYPRHRRGTALGILALGVPVGTAIGSTAGGYLAEVYGWRTALFILGIPGLVLAVLFYATLREPRRGECQPTTAKNQPPPLSTVYRLLAVKRSFWHLIIAVAVISIAVFGIGVFLPVYFTRVVGLGLGQTGVLNGIVGAVSTIGYFSGGVAVDRLRQRDERWHAWFAAIGVAVGAPFYMLAFHIMDPILATVLLTIGGATMFLYYTPVHLMLQSMVEARMRATVAFIFFFASGLVGAGLGPSLVGLISDTVAARAFSGGDFAALCGAGVMTAPSVECGKATVHGLRVALTAVSFFFLWAFLHLLWASRTLQQDFVFTPPLGKAAASGGL